MRMSGAGERIGLDPLIQGTHLKAWTLSRMMRTDYAGRGLPWARLLLESGEAPSTLNLGWRHRASALASIASLMALLLRRPRTLAVALLALVALNAHFYSLLWRRLGAIPRARRSRAAHPAPPDRLSRGRRSPDRSGRRAGYHCC